MQFNFKFGFKKTAESNFQIISVIGNFWRKIYKFIFLFLLLGVIIFSFYIWQNSLSGGSWSEQKKEEYLNSQSKRIILKENDFKKAIEDVELRRQEFIKQEPIRDIFKSY
ncbi:MAG: hypothetical protein ACD_9C00184G0002 [uncultured bacterium]|nr:MAG: hypothetical protein ACD_9C00184G0002 [uncultured bacterium]